MLMVIEKWLDQLFQTRFDQLLTKFAMVKPCWFSPITGGSNNAQCSNPEKKSDDRSGWFITVNPDGIPLFYLVGAMCRPNQSDPWFIINPEQEPIFHPMPYLYIYRGFSINLTVIFWAIYDPWGPHPHVGIIYPDSPLLIHGIGWNILLMKSFIQ
jgi:hypothetical protein